MKLGTMVVTEYNQGVDMGMQNSTIRTLINLHIDEFSIELQKLLYQYIDIVESNAHIQIKELINLGKKKQIRQKPQVSTKADDTEIPRIYKEQVNEEVKKGLEQRPVTTSKYVTETMSKEVQQILSTSETEGLGNKEVARRLRKKFQQLKGYQARRIARTEINAVNNEYAYQQLVLDDTVDYKQWIATHDHRTRESHQELDGEITRVADPFSNGLLFPGDHSGAPKEFINCRCTVVPYYVDWNKVAPDKTQFNESDLKERPADEGIEIKIELDENDRILQAIQGYVKVNPPTPEVPGLQESKGIFEISKGNKRQYMDVGDALDEYDWEKYTIAIDRITRNGGKIQVNKATGEITITEKPSNMSEDDIKYFKNLLRKVHNLPEYISKPVTETPKPTSKPTNKPTAKPTATITTKPTSKPSTKPEKPKTKPKQTSKQKQTKTKEETITRITSRDTPTIPKTITNPRDKEAFTEIIGEYKQLGATIDINNKTGVITVRGYQAQNSDKGKQKMLAHYLKMGYNAKEVHFTYHEKLEGNEGNTFDKLKEKLEQNKGTIKLTASGNIKYTKGKGKKPLTKEEETQLKKLYKKEYKDQINARKKMYQAMKQEKELAKQEEEQHKKEVQKEHKKYIKELHQKEKEQQKTHPKMRKTKYLTDKKDIQAYKKLKTKQDCADFFGLDYQGVEKVEVGLGLKERCHVFYDSVHNNHIYVSVKYDKNPVEGPDNSNSKIMKHTLKELLRAYDEAPTLSKDAINAIVVQGDGYLDVSKGTINTNIAGCTSPLKFAGERKTVRLFPSAFSQNEKYGNFVRPLYHEMGHCIDYSLMDRDVAKMIEEGNIPKNINKIFSCSMQDKEWKKACKADKELIENKHETYGVASSPYGSTSQKENFAEAMSMASFKDFPDKKLAKIDDNLRDSVDFETWVERHPNKYKYCCDILDNNTKAEITFAKK